MRFTYTAEKTDGEIYKGVAEAGDRFELYNVVRREGGKILSVDEDRSGSLWSFAYWNSVFSTVKEYDKILTARNLGAMLGAGLSLARGLAILERQTKNPKLSSILSQVGSDVRRGDTLHAALAKYPKVFSHLFAAMVRAGEESGNLAEALQTISDQMERTYTLKRKIRGALIYPCVILCAIFGIGVFMMTDVVPSLATTFKQMNVPLPFTTQVIIGMSNFLVMYTLWAALIFIAAVAAVVVFFKTRIGGRIGSYGLLKTPVIGNLIRETNAARTARTLSSLLSSGVDVIGSLEISGEVVQNPFFREVIVDAKKSVGQGEPLSAAFVRREDLYPPFVGEMMSVGEETGQLAEMLKRLAVFYEDEVDSATRDMSTIIEPVLMLIIGAAVGFFAVSMITPIYSLSNNIGS
ncbi:MAG TPA: type II secretion system F family protein [Candidatus Paceibacterota bacterium]|jgi:type IV pilus assembly protein PilC|nr:type II secretion system F family protein [Candidatus Paceibacterota bacterium]